LEPGFRGSDKSFQQIVGVVRSGLGLELTLGANVIWLNVPEKQKVGIRVITPSNQEDAPGQIPGSIKTSTCIGRFIGLYFDHKEIMSRR
jgi:hypothetical protein